ncbi:unnamed protein product [Didymodactylos carnosus]|uniref:DUF1254 domain-containing protein n=1 Tax=Didymodactylos carnosus TaxID=1234261 RepID=A0A815A114_9BILA|nr:unnamed protein product [Didymodactylos carnosus]CAF1249663.1 unnamed protein product [Didymodactylos carnosus]CAF4018303.1 unnamed protein product [Didymodactylos carnosus]CAF4028320.1 unnamed protein product [Didymodactylos carnosus]
MFPRILILIHLTICISGLPSIKEIEEISEQAFIYGYPIVDNYRIMYAYAIGNNSQYKGPFNQIVNMDRLLTPNDTIVQTPNVDTLYSSVWLDLRLQPVILHVPNVEQKRYYSVQLVDLFTYILGYIGSRTTGNAGGKFLVVGPSWQRQHKHVKINKELFEKVFYSDTDYVFAIYRTQIFNNDDDIKNVTKIQEEYKVELFQEHFNVTKNQTKNIVKMQKKVDFPAYDLSIPVMSLKSKQFFNLLNFLLKFSLPVHASEVKLYKRFSMINVRPGMQFPYNTFTVKQQHAFEQGIKTAKILINKTLNSNNVSSINLFGTRKSLKTNYLERTLGAIVGIYGNEKNEAVYYSYRYDQQHQQIDCQHNNYTMTFQRLPPVKAFWSVTMYNEHRLLVENSINRYSINSRMEKSLVRGNNNQSITLFIQQHSPGKELESNWLPASNGKVLVVLRLYWPEEVVLNGNWTRPMVVKTNN